MIRKFYLENEKGQQFHFRYSSGVLFSDINGLGFSHDITYLKFDHIYQVANKNLTFSEITGVLSFLDGYEGYDRFIRFVTYDSKDLKLFYTSFDTKYVYIDIVGLSKTEIKNGILSSDIILNKKSYWIKERVIIFDIKYEISGKVYPYIYNYSYQNVEYNKVNLNINGSIKASTVIEISGSISNPELNVIKDNSIISSLKINVTKNDAKIIISSVPNDRYIFMLDNEEKNDIYHLQDFEKDNFIYLEPGNITLEFKPGTFNDNSCKILLYEYYLG